MVFHPERRHHRRLGHQLGVRRPGDIAEGVRGTPAGRCQGCPGKDYPALYVTGSYNNQQGIFRSDDMGTTTQSQRQDQTFEVANIYAVYTDQ